ncbi:MAG TPA: thiolase [Steroidobacteraceae bacterium]|nr:thiolase [Steroidobacteraceae bacterium]
MTAVFVVSAVRTAIGSFGGSLRRFEPGDLAAESNEAFAAQACAVSSELGLDPARTNPNGGAIALGHPIGATGAILVTKLVHELHRSQGRYGLATMCIGGGQGIAAIFERVRG